MGSFLKEIAETLKQNPTSPGSHGTLPVVLQVLLCRPDMALNHDF